MTLYEIVYICEKHQSIYPKNVCVKFIQNLNDAYSILMSSFKDWDNIYPYGWVKYIVQETKKETQ